MSDTTSRPSRRRHQAARRRTTPPRTAPRMTLSPDLAPPASTNPAERVVRDGLGPYESRYDVARGYTVDRFIVMP